MPGLDEALSSLSLKENAPKPKLSLFEVKSADATPAAEEVALRGGADAAFDGWGEERDDEAPEVKRCLADDTWDAIMGDPQELIGLYMESAGDLTVPDAWYAIPKLYFSLKIRFISSYAFRLVR